MKIYLDLPGEGDFFMPIDEETHEICHALAIKEKRPVFHAFEFDVPDELVERWKRIFRDFSDMQDEIEDCYAKVMFKPIIAVSKK